MAYPEPYSPLYHNISYLGGLANNPQSALGWNIGMGIVGILLIPHQLYLHHHIMAYIPTTSPHQSNQLLLKCALGCRIIACLGIVFIAIFPEDLGIWHMIPAFGVFFGFLFAFNIDFVLLWRNRNKIISGRGFLGLWAVIGWMDLTFLGLMITQLFPMLLTQWGISSIALGLSPWEWSLFVSYFGWMGGLLAFFPEMDTNSPMYTKDERVIEKEKELKKSRKERKQIKENESKELVKL